MRAVAPSTESTVFQPEEPTRPHASYTVKPGDSLSKIAMRLSRQGVPGGWRNILGKLIELNPEVSDPDLIRAGATIRVPPAPRPARASQPRTEPWRGEPEPPRVRSAGGAANSPALAAGSLAAMDPKRLSRTQLVPASGFFREDGRPFPVSKDGAPRYAQADAEWANVSMGNAGRSLARSGCALTSVAMALSKLSGETITPSRLDAHLDSAGGYSGNAIVWGKAGEVTASPFLVQKSTVWNIQSVDAELLAGRPVVIGVDYKKGASGGNSGTDHWLCLTRKERQGTDDVYFANDPRDGSEVRLKKDQEGKLVEDTILTRGRDAYRTSGEQVTFLPA
ncbi:MAG: LysM peptidoglycan-binding domain-containing protein [Myxococcales bacterium]|nr:LysM peptidoglycan-binding domain-containing protein [Myxococcales bacterium]